MDIEMLETTVKNAPSAGAAAGAWWSAVLSDPKFDNGADDLSNLMAQTMAKMMSNDNTQQGSALEAFARELGEYVDKQLSRGRDRISLGVDYHPDLALSECADRAGVTVGMLQWPWKTHMWVTPRERQGQLRLPGAD